MEETKRLFVGNLPHGIADSEVRSQFGNYGKISSLEIKSKKGADGNVIATFAFIDLTVSGSRLSQCLNDTNGSDMGGNRIRVQIAKESFMDKLRAEREQLSKTNGPTKPDQPLKNNVPSGMNFPPKNNNSIKFDAPTKHSSSIKFDAPTKHSSSITSESKASYNPLQMIRSQKASIQANNTASHPPQNEKLFGKANQKENSFKKVEKPSKKVVAESSSDDSSDSDEDTVTTSKKSATQKKKGSLMSELENYSGMWNDLDSKPVEVDRRTKSSIEAERQIETASQVVEEIPKEQPVTKSRVEDLEKQIVDDETAKKRELDNQKRIQSLQERSKALQAQSFQIQSALSLTDKKMNRKIVFDQNGDEETSVKGKKNPSSEKAEESEIPII